MSIWLAIGLIALCAACWDVGIVLQKLASDELPRLTLGSRLPEVVLAFARSKRWILGLAVTALGWGLFAVALSATPVSVARAVQGSGLVILALFSILFLRHRLSAIEWVGILVVTASVVLLGLSESRSPEGAEHVEAERVAGVAAAMTLLSFAGYPAARLLKGATSPLVAVSVQAGVLIGLGDLMTKALLIEAALGRDALAFGLFGPLLALFYLTGFLILSRGYQRGRALVVTAVSDFSSRLTAMILGLLALGEGASSSAGAELWIGFAGILAGTWLLLRAPHDEIARRIARGRA